MAFIQPIPLVTPRALQGGVSASKTRRVPAPKRRDQARMLVVEAGSIADIDKILKAADDSLVVVDYSTTWCGPCKAIAPVFEELSEKHTDVVFVKVIGDKDADASELMKREGIRAVPAFHFWKNKDRVEQFTGARTDELERLITELK